MTAPLEATPALGADDALVGPGSGKSRTGAAAAIIVIALLLSAFVAWIALTPLPSRRPPLVPWISIQAPGFRVEMPDAPMTATVAFGAGHVATAVDGPDAFTVIWFPTEAAADPSVVLSRALVALRREPATITLTVPGRTGPFPSADVAARLPSAYLRGRLMVVGRRTYLVAEITPAEAVPPDLTRLLSGFDPDPTAT